MKQDIVYGDDNNCERDFNGVAYSTYPGKFTLLHPVFGTEQKRGVQP